MVYVVILEKKPAHKAAEQLLTLRREADGFAILAGRSLHCAGAGKTPCLQTTWSKKILGIAGTTRNLTTFKKLVEKYAQTPHL